MTGKRRFLNFFHQRRYSNFYSGLGGLVLHDAYFQDLRGKDRYRFFSDFFSLDADDKGTPLLSVDKPKDVVDLVRRLG